MSDDNEQEKPQQKPVRIKTDGQGRSVWADTIVTVQLELVSAQQLDDLLASDDDAARRSIENAASKGDKGVLARDAATGLFEIIDDFDVQTIIDGNLEQVRKPNESAGATLEPVGAESSATSDELSLVTTQMLRRVLRSDNESELEFDDGDSGGFDPYNSR